MASTATFAQTSPFVYDFGDATGSFAPNPGESSKKFMPKIIGSSKSIKPVVRIRTASDGTGAFTFVNKGASFIKGSGVEILGGTSTSKLGMYDLEMKTITKTSIDIKFDASNSGQWIIGNGNSNNEDDVFQGNSSVKDQTDEFFSAYRWVLSEENELKFYVRVASKWEREKEHPFVKNQEYRLDIYSNNSATEQVCMDQKLPAGTYMLMVNGKKVGGINKSGGIAVNKNLNAFIVLGYIPKESNDKLKAWVDNLTISETL